MTNKWGQSKNLSNGLVLGKHGFMQAMKDSLASGNITLKAVERPQGLAIGQSSFALTLISD